MGPTTTLAPPLTAPPAEPLVSSDIGAILEFDGRLYAFGHIWVTEPGTVGEAATFAWSSDDGLTWDRTAVGSFPQLIDAIALGDAMFLFGREMSDGEDDGPPLPSTYIVQSSAGTRWEPVAAVGLEGAALWAVAPSENGLVAIGERYDRDESRRAAEEERVPDDSWEEALIFTSPDGITWSEAGPWTISPLNQSAWEQVDLFPSPYGIVAVSATEEHQPTGEPSQIVIAISTDGVTFSLIDTSDPALWIENKRTERWPPITPPEGTVFGNQIFMLGLSYPSASGRPSYHQWLATIDAISPPATSTP